MVKAKNGTYTTLEVTHCENKQETTGFYLLLRHICWSERAGRALIQPVIGEE